MRCLDLVRALETELDEFGDQRGRIDGLCEADVLRLLTEQNDRLVVTQRHVLKLVSLLAEIDDLDAGRHLALLEPVSDSG